MRREFMAGLLAAFLVLALPGTALAQLVEPEVTFLQLESADDGVFLAATVRFDLPPVVEDALTKGIAMYFVAEADVYRSRWYWYDKRVASAARHMRLAYQPLTRRWRLNVASGVIAHAGLGVTLNQNFDSLFEALSAMQRISHWKIAEVEDFETDVPHNVDFRFRLDVSQLPRPFQIGAVGQADWNIVARKTVRLTVERTN
jgi:hypothetical protein